MEGKTVLRPGITNPRLWHPERPPRHEWNKIRRIVLERDNYTCSFCGHRAKKYMNIHHTEKSGDNSPDNLTTICAACHAVSHIGRNLDLGVIEIWESDKSQVDIIRYTREGVKNGKSLNQIKKELPLRKGPYPPDSVEYANSMIPKMRDAPRGYLDEPLCAVFVKFKRWQIE